MSRALPPAGMTSPRGWGLDRRVSLPLPFKVYEDRADLIKLSDGQIFAQEVVNERTVRAELAEVSWSLGG